MSALTKDLPDPLDPTPTITASDPDDLLSKMADEAIDRLMADADRGQPPPAVPPPATPAVVMDDATAADEPAGPETTDVPPAPGAGPATAEGPEPVPTAEAIASAGSAVVDDTTAAPPAPFEDAEAVPPLVAAAAAEPAPPPAADRQALLADPTDAVPPASPLLWPLRVLNAPFARLSDDARTAFGLIGIVTLVPSACVFLYLYWLRHH